MRIAVNARFLLRDYLEGIGGFTFEVVTRLAAAHPDDELLLFFDRPYDRRFVTAPNVQPIVLWPPARHPLLWLWWFEGSLAGALRRRRPDVFLSPDGFGSLTGGVPTLLVVHDIVFERFAGGLGELSRLYYRLMTPAWIRRAARIATVSEFSKRELIETYRIAGDRIDVIANGVGEGFRPRGADEVKAVRRRHAGDADYFLHLGAIHPRKNVATLLRAFDLFKRQTLRPTRLLLAGRLAWKYRDVLRAHAAMRHGEDVVFLGYVPAADLPGIVAAALAVVSVSLYEGFGLPVIEAMASAVPVIAARRAALPEVAGDAALFVDPSDPAAIAAAMEDLAGDAGLRADLTGKGLERARRYDWNRTAEALRLALLRIANSSSPSGSAGGAPAAAELA
jgi:glycosyltransferase involved in cell wall biosynthesis